MKGLKETVMKVVEFDSDTQVLDDLYKAAVVATYIELIDDPRPSFTINTFRTIYDTMPQVYLVATRQRVRHWKPDTTEMVFRYLSPESIDRYKGLLKSNRDTTRFNLRLDSHIEKLLALALAVEPSQAMLQRDAHDTPEHLADLERKLAFFYRKRDQVIQDIADFDLMKTEVERRGFTVKESSQKATGEWRLLYTSLKKTTHILQHTRDCLWIDDFVFQGDLMDLEDRLDRSHATEDEEMDPPQEDDDPVPDSPEKVQEKLDALNVTEAPPSTTPKKSSDAVVEKKSSNSSSSSSSNSSSSDSDGESDADSSKAK
jgi:hypothetical protein